MRKLMKIAIALGMVLCLCTTAFATANPGDSGTNTTNLTNAVGANGQVAQVTESAPTAIPTATEAVEVLKNVAPAGTTAQDLSVVYAMDLSVPAEQLPVTITFEVKGAKATDEVYVLHYNGSTWDVVAHGKGGTIDATFTSLSPVAVVLQAAATTPDAAPSDSTPAAPEASDSTPAAPEADAGTTTSPQTGADMTLVYVGVAVFLAAGVVALVSKKKSA